jgi:hypothetical protein
MIGLTLVAVLGFAAPPIVHASAEDCAVIVSILQSRAAWTANGPNTPLVIDGKQSDGSLYRQDCDWKALGVGDPIPIGPDRARIGIERPAYGANGVTATAGVSFFAPRGRTAPAFMAVWTCRLRKTGTTWEVADCVEGAIN